MTTLRLYSEPFSPMGNISGEGFRNLLGRPTSGLLSTLLREALQNCLDASRSSASPEVLLRVRELNSSEQTALVTRILSALPESEQSKEVLSESIGRTPLRVLEICDFGTTGLAGPTRADVQADDSDKTDFVNFMRNVGAARDVHHGGGTYGYGKTSLYAASRCATVVVDTETTAGGEPVRRLMACHLGGAFEADTEAGDRKRFTGRHWWGIPDSDGYPEPAEEQAAIELASDLGLPKRDRGDSGTSILIVDPLFTDDELESLGESIVEAVLWNFWPRMTEGTPRQRKMNLKVEVNGSHVDVPRPESFPPLDLFAAALKDVRSRSENSQVIESRSLGKDLGRISIQKGVCGSRRGPAVRDGSAIPGQAAHIALMRPVELIVKYLEGEPFPDRRYEWAGVFMCSDQDEVEQAFASAEPPAHDDWMPEILPLGPARTMVNVARRELGRIAKTHAVPGPARGGNSLKGPSLAAAAALMGHVLGQASRGSPGKKKVSRGSGGKTRKPVSVSQPSFVRLIQDEAGKPVAVFHATVTNDGSNPEMTVKAEPYLVMDGGAASDDDLPEDYALDIRSMRFGFGGPKTDSDELKIGKESGDIEIEVEMPSSAAAAVRLSLGGGSEP